ncbi:MAG: leucine--tRNA ligase [Chitinivibrionales bacterium]|nr:leucine--tRNA ligase [Chitinivibrionales bacterium]
MADYNFREIEAKWQKLWQETKAYKAEDTSTKPKGYFLEMFPYPSGKGLHVGHLKNYAPMDAYCRFKSMNGISVLHPMGWDAFGQPAENEALKNNRNPAEMVPQYAQTYRNTLKLAGCSYDWDREINSSLPDYYRWTQWFFLLLFNKGLAYQQRAPINWCPSCKTGLANEEVSEGKCWRCGSVVEKKPMNQWFFKITAYADRLLAGLDSLNWSAGMKEMQRDWIGRSEGALINFAIENSKESVTVFTTRPDTLFGATFLVLAPEHPLVSQITTQPNQEAVFNYTKKAERETEIDRMNAERVKTGAFTGAYARNPITDKPIPIWIADYVLMGYGSGAIMAVPGHDQRDFEFAQKFNLPIVQVVSTDGSICPALSHAEDEEGIAVNCGQFTGLTTNECKKQIIAWLEQKGVGKQSVTYRLRDWLISRQRYWGAPIPIIHCPECGTVGVPQEQLPVLLPEVKNYQPSGTGESPLATIPEFVNTSCPHCGKPARRETDTMGGYACSSWYFLRFADPHNSHAFADPEKVNYWLPVDLYAGGIEHARSHLLYARFWTKVLYDSGYVKFQEPFLTLKNQGSLLAYTPGRKPCQSEAAQEDDDEKILDWIVLNQQERQSMPAEQIVWRWARMSKSKGNVITPDEIAHRYGADTLRVYVMFVAPFEDDVKWSEEGIQGSFRFMGRVWRWMDMHLSHYQDNWKEQMPSDLSVSEMQARRKLHQTIAKVTSDLDSFQFNTAIAMLMELTNEVYSVYPLDSTGPNSIRRPQLISELIENIILLLAPFAPHCADELWQRIGKKTITYNSHWPQASAAAAAQEQMTIALQVNGKLRDTIVVGVNDSEEAIKEKAFQNSKIASHVSGKTVKRVIYVPKRLLNIVVA